MSVKEIKALVRRFFEEVNKGKAAAMTVIDELFTIDYVEHGGMGEYTHGLKDYKKSISEFYSAFPDIHFTIDDMVVEGDKVAVCHTFSGTQSGIYGCPPYQ